MWVFIALGLGIGIVSGMLGIGGGILLIPGLMWLAGDQDYRHAAAMTLAVLTMPVFLPSSYRYLSSGILKPTDLTTVAFIAIGVAVGALLGAQIVHQIPEQVSKLQFAFGLLLLYLGLRSVLESNGESEAALYGLLAFVVGWLCYAGLRILGRRHLARPNLTASIQSVHGHAAEPIDYSI